MIFHILTSTEMVTQMKNVVRLNSELSKEERNLFVAAYKHQIGSRRASWRIITSIIQRDETKNINVHLLPKAKEFQMNIENEIATIIDDALQLIDNHILPNSKTIENQVFFLKMQGDYNRYLAELSAQTEATNRAQQAYTTATNLAKTGLTPTNPIRLSLALSFSVFYYEILKDTDTSLQISRTAFDEAIPLVDSLDEQAFKEAAEIMVFLRDSFSLRVCDDNDDEGDKV